MRLLHEGSDIQVLLGEIRAQHGASARIVKAERIRTGGIAGFFAKQHFEVTLDVAAEPGVSDLTLPAQRSASASPAAAPAASPSGESALEALMAAADREDLNPAGVQVEDDLRTSDLIYEALNADSTDAFSTVLNKVTEWQQTQTEQETTVPSEPSPTAVADSGVATQAEGLQVSSATEYALGTAHDAHDLDLTDLTDHSSAPDTGAAVVDHQPAAADLLSVLDDEAKADHGLTPELGEGLRTYTPVPHDAPVLGAANLAGDAAALSGLYTRQSGRTAARVEPVIDAPLPQPVIEESTSSEPMPGEDMPGEDMPDESTPLEPMTFEPVAATAGPRVWNPPVLQDDDLATARVLRQPEASRPQSRPAAPAPAPLTTPAPAPQPAAPATPAPQPATPERNAAQRNPAARAAAQTAPRTRRERREQLHHQAVSSPVLNRLAELGVPASVLNQLPAEPSTADLAGALSGLPRASSSRPDEGEVIAILVEPGEADAAGSRIARRWRMDRGNVAGRSGSSRLSGDRQAARLADEARRSGEPQLLVLDAELNGFDAEWAGDILAAAQPDRVIAVVDATRKPHDIDSWLTAITGMVDAIMLVNTSSTATPAAVLGLGIPVSEIDGRPGTPAEWASLLMARVFEKNS